MTRPTLVRAFAVLVVATVLAGPPARGTSQTDRDTLNTILKQYAAEEGATTAATLARTTLTASADDLVAAVYEAILKDPTLTPQQVADLAAAALESPDGVKVRADKDKVAARILEAAIIARGAQTDATQADLLIYSIANVNATLTAAKQLTAAGKEALIGKAIRATAGLGATIAAEAKALSFGLSGTPDAKLTTFAVAALKTLTYKPQVYDPALASTSQATETTKGPLVQLNNAVPEGVAGQPLYNSNGVPPSIAGVRDFVDTLLDGYTGLTKLAAALKLAEGVATLPSVAGAVIGGLIQDQKPGHVNDDNLQTILVQAVADTKLAAAIADIVDNGISQYTVNDKVGAATSLAMGQSAVNKGKIASGAVRAVPGSANAIVTNILGIVESTPSKAVSQSGLAAFATAAATGNGNAGTAAEISAAVINRLTPKATQPADLTAIQAIAINVIKAVAPANPDAAFEIAQKLFEVKRAIGTNLPVNYYSAAAADGGTAARAQLAADLAKGAATNYTAAGAAVAGVVQKAISIDSVTTGLDVSITAAAIHAAAKASLSIAQKTSAALLYAGASARVFASGLALASISTNAGAIAAGVALTDTGHAGDIVKAVITSNGSTTQSPALNKAAATIANTVAVNVDVEAIVDIAQKVGSLYQPKTGATNANLPRISTLGALATSLAKAINTKPLVSQHNRVDELGELAAVLVTDSIGVAGGNTAASLAAVGTNIFKAVSAKLLADVGNNAADLLDVAGDVAGAIAQTIAAAPTLTVSGVGGFTQAEKDALLNPASVSTTGSLLKLLATGAKSSGFAPTTAFGRVYATRDGATGAYGIVAGTEMIGTNGTATTFGRYEIGNVSDPETRIKNL